ncbi:hypothetical protein MMC08_000467 [Hypocenomyce scalaris]|nr:hypothetical protein [Hypocenomyce scalaris]
MRDVHCPVHSKVSTRIHRSQPEKDLENQVKPCGGVRTSEWENTPEFRFQRQLFRKLGGFHPGEPRLLHVRKFRFPEDPAKEALPAANAVPSSGSLKDPERDGVAEQEHAAYPPHDFLCPGGKDKVPTHEMYGGVEQGRDAKNTLLISLEVGEPVIAQPREWSLKGSDRHVHERLHIQGLARAQIVDEI